jgi:hypothetical protein
MTSEPEARPEPEAGRAVYFVEEAPSARKLTGTQPEAEPATRREDAAAPSRAALGALAAATSPSPQAGRHAAREPADQGASKTPHARSGS